jgi:hypothetical protein
MILSGGIVWLAATRGRGWSRSVGRIFGSPWRMASGWFLLVALGLGLTVVTCQSISKPSAGSDGGMIGGMLSAGASIATFGDSVENALLAGLMVLVTLGLNWRWKRLAAKQANE